MQRGGGVSDGRRDFDLEERCAVFGEQGVLFCKTIPFNAITNRIIDQFIRAATSVGSNYGEANDAESRKDFRHKICICRKESKECKHQLRMLAVAHEPAAEWARKLWQEAKELNLIFGKIVRSLDGE